MTRERDSRSFLRMGFAFEHRGREPERVFRNDRYSDFSRGPVHEDPRVAEERERALMRAAFAASRTLEPQDAARPTLAAKLNGPQAAGLVIQRSPQTDDTNPVIEKLNEPVDSGIADCFENCAAEHLGVSAALGGGMVGLTLPLIPKGLRPIGYLPANILRLLSRGGGYSGAGAQDRW